MFTVHLACAYLNGDHVLYATANASQPRAYGLYLGIYTIV